MRGLPTIYLDLDRTLLDTDRFFDGLWGQMTSRLSLRTDEKQRASEFYIIDGDSYIYDFFAHVKNLGLNVTTDEIVSWLPSDEYLYGDVAGFLRRVEGRDVRILTYGTVDYQKLKIAVSPLLEGLPVDITRRPKSEFYAKRPERAVLIDDKDLTGQLPSQVRFVRILRDQVGAVSVPSDDNIVVNSLNHISERWLS